MILILLMILFLAKGNGWAIPPGAWIVFGFGLVITVLDWCIKFIKEMSKDE